MLVLDRVFEKQGIQIPKLLIGKNVIHLPTVKTHVFTGTTGAMKNAFGGLLQPEPPLDALGDPRDAGRPAARSRRRSTPASSR